jgi:hypothetical protein
MENQFQHFISNSLEIAGSLSQAINSESFSFLLDKYYFHSFDKAPLTDLSEGGRLAAHRVISNFKLNKNDYRFVILLAISQFPPFWFPSDPRSFPRFRLCLGRST